MAAFALAAVVFAQAATGGNALPNGSFERPLIRPEGWDQHTYGGRAAFGYGQDGRGGSACVSIASETGADAAWFTRARVLAYSRYRLSGWIKTDGLRPSGGKGALINLHQGPSGQSEALSGDTDWTQVSFEFETGAHETVQINCLFGGWGLATGKAWFDDLELTFMGPQPLSPSVTIDISKTGHPISKFVYGQFIEHLGRCIYGGIWAEMLEDRKFFYGVGAADSPWKADGTVDMTTENPYVGQHTPVLSPSSRIFQGGLGVRSGKLYVGRIVLSGTGSVAVRLVWGDGARQRDTVSIRSLTPVFTKYPIKFRAGKSVDDARLEIEATGAARVGAVSLMPSDHVHGMRKDTLALLRELNSPVYRWPGGNFVSGYDWRDGVGDPDTRPPRKNPAWLGVEHNDFGIHEFMRFCELLDTEPFIAVNSGLGDVEMARDEVEYVNGGAGTAMGRLRAQHGHREPWRCTFWSIGNEMYGNWQLGHMPLEQYVAKHNQFADAMRAVDADIKLIGVGDSGSKWSETMLAHCADHMDYLSEHFYTGAKPGLLEHVRQIPENVRRKAEAHRRYHREIPALQGKFVPIALDEWNYWYGPHIFGELGTRYFLQDALGIAAGLHEMARNSDIFYMANYAQTVNVIGCIKTSKTAAAFETTGLVLKLYREHFGEIPLDVSGDLTPLDVCAALTKDRKYVTVGIVNPLEYDLVLKLGAVGNDFGPRASSWTVTASDRMAYNDPDGERPVKIDDGRVRVAADGVEIPRISVTLLKLRVR